MTTLAAGAEVRLEALFAPATLGRPTNSRLACADALRAIAILAVVAHHLAQFTHVQINGRERMGDWMGVWGVDCFFVLTGYLLSKPYLRAMLEGTALPSMRQFLARR